MERFASSDIQLASFLITLGHELVGVDGPPERKRFVFGRVPPADITAYYAGAHPVPPLDLFRHYRALKRLVFEGA